MTLFLLSFLAGALTLLAPCILPVLPFVFVRAGRPFARNGLPLLIGLAIAFAAVGTLGAVAGEWAVQTNEWGRAVAMTMLALVGLSLLWPAMAARLGQPLAAVGSRIASAGARRPQDPVRHPALTSMLLGMATGLLWAPCAGPLLGLVLTGAAIEGPSVRTSLLLLAYAAGAASSLALVLLAGDRVAAALRRRMAMGEMLRRLLGVAVLASVAITALGLDTRLLAGWSNPGSDRLEKSLLQRLVPMQDRSPTLAPALSEGARRPTFQRVQSRATPPIDLPDRGAMPPLDGATEWLNSAPLNAQDLRGKVVLVEFWTYGCSNCLNALPKVREWHRKYKDEGLVVLGVHSPEFAFEKNIGNVRKAIARLDIQFPVVVDNRFAIWRAFSNQYWPAFYFVDAKGRTRFMHIGEGEYERSEQVIRQLLEEARRDGRPT